MSKSRVGWSTADMVARGPAIHKISTPGDKSPETPHSTKPNSDGHGTDAFGARRGNPQGRHLGVRAQVGRLPDPGLSSRRRGRAHQSGRPAYDALLSRAPTRLPRAPRAAVGAGRRACGRGLERAG